MLCTKCFFNSSWPRRKFIPVSYDLHHYTVYKVAGHADVTLQVVITDRGGGLLMIASFFNWVKNAFFRYLNKCAVIIQKTWRGFIGRRYARIAIKHHVMIMRLNYYQKMAAIIQRRWRGYYIRNYVHNFIARKRYFKALEIKNQVVRRELEAIKQKRLYEEKYRERKEFEKFLTRRARENHHLISTHVMPGVYNSPFLHFPDDMELRLKAVFHLDYVNQKKKTRKKASKLQKPDLVPRPPQSSGDYQQVQGPFKPMHLVKQQRNKPFRIHMRCNDNADLIAAREKTKRDDWAKDIHAEPFHLYSKHRPPYEGLVHTRSHYDVSNNVVLRKENPSQHISKTKMRTVLSPIFFFDKIGEAYTKGATLL